MNQVAIFILLILLSGSALAGNSQRFADSAGAMHFGLKLGTSNIVNSPTGFGLFGAYTVFGPNTFGENNFLSKSSIAVEGEFVDLGNSVSDIKLSTTSASTFGLVAVVTYPISQQYSVLAKAGWASLTHKYRSSCTWSWCNFNSTTKGVHGGAAGQYNLSEALVIRAGYDFYPDGITMLSISAVSRF